MEIAKIEGLIHILRGHRVMLDRDLAELYGVPTKSINLAVKRNRIRFPDDFVLRLSVEEASSLKFQIETSSWGGHREHLKCQIGISRSRGGLTPRSSGGILPL